MFFAPKGGRHGPTLAVDRDDVELVAPGSLDGRDVEPKNIAVLMGTFNMDWSRISF